MNQYQYTQSILKRNQETIAHANEVIERTKRFLGTSDEPDLVDDMQDRTEHDNHVTNNQI